MDSTRPKTRATRATGVKVETGLMDKARVTTLTVQKTKNGPQDGPTSIMERKGRIMKVTTNSSLWKNLITSHQESGPKVEGKIIKSGDMLRRKRLNQLINHINGTKKQNKLK